MKSATSQKSMMASKKPQNLRELKSAAKKIENHNFLKIAESLTLSFYRGYNQELKHEYLNAIRFALNNEDLDYANCVLVDYSNWLLKKRKKYYAKRL